MVITALCARVMISARLCHRLCYFLLPILISTLLPVPCVAWVDFLQLPNGRMLTCLQPLLYPAASSLSKNAFLQQDLIQNEEFKLNSRILSKSRFISSKALASHARKYGNTNVCYQRERDRDRDIQTSRWQRNVEFRAVVVANEAT